LCHLLNHSQGSLSGLASQTTARQGNALGVLGVSSGILASLGAVGFPPAVIAQFAGAASIGGIAGAIIGRRVTATELPQTVAMLHSIVGLSACLTSIGSVLADTAHASNLHLVTAYLGVVIGGIIRTSMYRSSFFALRRNYFHWFNCRVLETCLPHVVEASGAARETLNQ
jgi:NAD/NADP transhydrogenase beta subunit